MSSSFSVLDDLEEQDYDDDDKDDVDEDFERDFDGFLISTDLSNNNCVISVISANVITPSSNSDIISSVSLIFNGLFFL